MNKNVRGKKLAFVARKTVVKAKDKSAPDGQLKRNTFEVVSAEDFIQLLERDKAARALPDQRGLGAQLGKLFNIHFTGGNERAKNLRRNKTALSSREMLRVGLFVLFMQWQREGKPRLASFALRHGKNTRYLEHWFGVFQNPQVYSLIMELFGERLGLVSTPAPSSAPSPEPNTTSLLSNDERSALTLRCELSSLASLLEYYPLACHVNNLRNFLSKPLDVPTDVANFDNFRGKQIAFAELAVKLGAIAEQLIPIQDQVDEVIHACKALLPSK